LAPGYCPEEKDVLDLTKVAPQIDAVVNLLRDNRDEHQAHLNKACDLLTKSAANLNSLKQKINASHKKTVWTMAGLVESPGARFPLPPVPPNHTVLATDGSQIDVDRHQSARCYLINIGRVRLDYGQNAGAELASLPKLCAGDEMFLSDGLRELAIEGALLGIKRTVTELSHLAEMSSEVPPERPTLALVDGSLIMWGLASERYPDFVSQELLENGYLKTLDILSHLAEHNCLTLASYISFSRATDVANAMRLILCPEAVADCDKHCKNVPSKKRPCEQVAGVRDSDIFGHLLKEGERSATFYSQSLITERYGPHRIYFFYLKLADEVARVEIPEWVALNQSKLDLTHALVWNQCLRGEDYPIALAEAHEQAVVTGADRAGFQQVLEQWLIAERLPQTTSAKSQSKRTRWV